MKCSEIITVLENLFPPYLAENYDNVGLLSGRKDKEVKKILVAVDASSSVICQAKELGADMLVTHHPLIFSPLKRVTDCDFIGKRIVSLIQSDISYCAMHTNYDLQAMADRSAEILGLLDFKVLEETRAENLYKLAVYVPQKNAETVHQAMADAGAGHLGNYSNCSFWSRGTGTFLPLNGAQPYIGTPGMLESVKEVKIETMVTADNKQTVIEAMLAAHPYEEPAYDLYQLEQKGRIDGIGKIGLLPEEMTLRECAKLVKERFVLENVRIFGSEEARVRCAAISPGSGKHLKEAAAAGGAQVLITGDIDHHEGIDALEMGVNIIDAGHYGLEKIFVGHMMEILKNHTDANEVWAAVESSPFTVI